MTEINIEHTKKRSIWPWLLALAALVLAIVLFNRDDEAGEAAVLPDTAAYSSPGALGGDTLRSPDTAMRR